MLRLFQIEKTFLLKYRFQVVDLLKNISYKNNQSLKEDSKFGQKDYKIYLNDYNYKTFRAEKIIKNNVFQ